MGNAKYTLSQLRGAYAAGQNSTRTKEARVDRSARVKRAIESTEAALWMLYREHGALAAFSCSRPGYESILAVLVALFGSKGTREDADEIFVRIEERLLADGVHESAVAYAAYALECRLEETIERMFVCENGGQ